MQAKALLFDTFGTLTDWRSSIARQIRPRLPDEATAFRFTDEWRALYQPAMEEVRSGRRPFAPLDVLHRENLDRILPDFGLEHLGKAERADITRFWHRLDPWPDVREGLLALRDQAITVVHSNANVALAVGLIRFGRLSFDAILGAEVTGHYKPQPECYLRACALLALPPGECMMVAAHNDDLEAAQGCGLQTAFIPRPLEHGPGQTKDLKPEGDWTIVAEDTDDLARKLRERAT
ncbi:2-haloacid dehalogenase [Faunimonas pinastri]|uniref:(S)-2-haloacid dehalogenase n=1 Tax=Faunimonas pinastri TaxID=1855383 RepID=A0A1H9P089_9HYPH|nr:haloacid dehalogenase type II [Faunimonas pinastri]SER41598.1 2-haloacid dehalogenase [Faunimonas pinastri]